MENTANDPYDEQLTQLDNFLSVAHLSRRKARQTAFIAALSGLLATVLSEEELGADLLAD